MSYWYIFWVLTGHERKAEKLVRNQLCDKDIEPFIPLWESLFRRGGKVKTELNIAFPGYLFIESSLGSTEFLQRTYNFVRRNKDMLNILRYGRSYEIAVRKEERTALERLFDDSHCVESSIGFIVGDKVYIESGPLVGMESIIQEINKKKMEAYLDMEFMGGTRRFTVGIELLRKI